MVSMHEKMMCVRETLLSEGEGYSDVKRLLTDILDDHAIDGQRLAQELGFVSFEAMLTHHSSKKYITVKPNAARKLVFYGSADDMSMHILREQRISEQADRAKRAIRMDSDNCRVMHSGPTLVQLSELRPPEPLIHKPSESGKSMPQIEISKRRPEKNLSFIMPSIERVVSEKDLISFSDGEDSETCGENTIPKREHTALNDFFSVLELTTHHDPAEPIERDYATSPDEDPLSQPSSDSSHPSNLSKRKVSSERQRRPRLRHVYEGEAKGLNDHKFRKARGQTDERRRLIHLIQTLVWYQGSKTLGLDDLCNVLRVIEPRYLELMAKDDYDNTVDWIKDYCENICTLEGEGDNLEFYWKGDE